MGVEDIARTPEKDQLFARRLFDQMHYDRKFERFIDNHVNLLWRLCRQGDREAQDRLMFLRNYCVTDMYDEYQVAEYLVGSFRDDWDRQDSRELLRRTVKDLRVAGAGMGAAVIGSFFETKVLYAIIPLGVAGFLYTLARGASRTERLQEEQRRFDERITRTYGSLEEALAYNIHVKKPSIHRFLEDKGFL